MIPKNAFKTKHNDYEIIVMSSGMTNAPSNFVTLIILLSFNFFNVLLYTYLIPTYIPKTMVTGY